MSNKDLSAVSLANIEALADGNGEQTNQNCGGLYCYPDRKSNGAQTCTLYKHISTSGSVTYSDSGASLGVGWTSVKVSGLQETCPQSGNGCTVYSCHVTTNTH